MYEIGVWGKNKRKAHLFKVSKFLIVLQELARNHFFAFFIASSFSMVPSGTFTVFAPDR